METKHVKSKTGAAGNQSDKSDASLRPRDGPPFPDLGEKMVIAIDGWAQTGKNTVGSLVAEYLGGVLVDSGRFYRALTLACLQAGVDFRNLEAVTAWLKTAT